MNATDDHHPEVRMDQVEFKFIQLTEQPLICTEDRAHVYCYVVRRGSAQMTMYQPVPVTVEIETGDVAVLSSLTAHRLSAQPSVFKSPGVDIIQARAPAESVDFMGSGSPLMHLRKRDGEPVLRHIWAAVQAIVDEYDDCEPLPWRNDITRRLAEIMVINITRAVAQRNWMVSGSFVDPRLLRAVGAVTRDLARSWTVADLAGQAGMSRTAFAVHYKAVLGETPAKGLARMRLHKAAIMLQQGRASVEAAAFQVGYAGSTPFGRAFQREFGVTPAQWKRGAKQPPNLVSNVSSRGLPLQ